MKDYRVVWEIELSARNAKEAAQEALAIQRDPVSMSTVFDVYRQGRSKPVRVDLAEAGMPEGRRAPRYFYLVPEGRAVPTGPAKLYVALSVFQGIIDEVQAYRSKTAADSFVKKFEREQGIKSPKRRKHQREYEDTYATWYWCDLEK